MEEMIDARKMLLTLKFYFVPFKHRNHPQNYFFFVDEFEGIKT
jgi:hypothetical protein